MPLSLARATSLTPPAAGRISSASPISSRSLTIGWRPDEIKNKEDLRGKRIAISGPGSTSHLHSLLAFHGLNIDPNQAKITFLTIRERR